MKILILGASGMLGHRLWINLRKEHEVWVTVRRNDKTTLSMLDPFICAGGAGLDRECTHDHGFKHRVWQAI